MRGMRVIRIGRVRPILPHVGLTESFLQKSSRDFPFVHWMMLANTGQIGALKTATPSPRHWGHRRKGASVFRREDRQQITKSEAGGGSGTSVGTPAGAAPGNPRRRFRGPPGPPSFTVKSAGTVNNAAAGSAR